MENLQVINEGVVNKREGWLDVVKAFGIFWVVVGHCDISNPGIFKCVISSCVFYHMALFYIVSGYLWDEKKYLSMSFVDYTKKKFKSYIIPYFKIATVCFIIFALGLNAVKFGGYNEEYLISLLKYLFGIVIYSRGTTEWLPGCSPIWFLTSLFFAEILYYAAMKSKHFYIYITLAGIAGWGLSYYTKLPWNIDNALTALPLLFIGTLVKKYFNVICKWYVPFIAIFLGLFIKSYIKSIINVEYDFDGNQFAGGNFIMYINTSLMTIGTFVTIYKLSRYNWGG